jgi:hypothetical protein
LIVHRISCSPKILKVIAAFADAEVKGNVVHLWSAKATASKDVSDKEIYIFSQDVDRSYVENLDKGILAGEFDPHPGCLCAGRCGIPGSEKLEKLTTLPRSLFVLPQRFLFDHFDLL